MTNEQRKYALKCLDTYAEIFGPKLAEGTMYNSAENICCATFALAIVHPVSTWLSIDPSKFQRAFGFAQGRVTGVNDVDGPLGETSRQRFRRMRRWIKSLPTAD